MTRLAPILLLTLMMTTTTAVSAENAKLSTHRKAWHTERPRHHLKRIVQYDLSSTEIPEEFEGFRIAFVSDTHYPSLFDDSTLTKMERELVGLRPDMLLLGGDYQEDCEHVEPLFAAFKRVGAPYGTYAVLGNNDFERCTDVIKESMERNGITLVEEKVVGVSKDGSNIVVAGAHNTFAERETTPSPTESTRESDFVMLLTHTPDYVQDIGESRADIALAGHTHAGQVTFLGLWAPKNPSHYGRKMLRGLKQSTSGTPVLITSGIGTSRANVRFCAPGEIIMIVLHHSQE